VDAQVLQVLQAVTAAVVEVLEDKEVVAQKA
jgi:hypothetical protein